MIDVNPWTLGLLGLFAGMLGAMLGIGGGIFIVPFLSLLLHIPIQTAIGCSLVTIVAGSMTAASTYIRDNVTNIKLGLLLESASIPGAILGALAVTKISSFVLSGLFGLLLLYCSFAMINYQRKPKQAVPHKKPVTETGQVEIIQNQWNESCYFDQEEKTIIRYRFGKIMPAMLISAFTGILASLLGVGGGIINIPVMNMIMGVPIKATIATSSFIIMTTAAVGALVFFQNGLINPFVAASLIIGAYIGARIGARLMQKTKGTLLRSIFAGIMIITAILMFLKAARVIT